MATYILGCVTRTELKKIRDAGYEVDVLTPKSDYADLCEHKGESSSMVRVYIEADVAELLELEPDPKI